MDSPLSFVECDSEKSWQEFVSTKHYDVIVDAMFATGLTPPLEGVYKHVVEHLMELRRARDNTSSSLPLFVLSTYPRA